MTESVYRCIKESELATNRSEINELFKEVDSMDKRISKNTDMREFLYSLDKSMAIQTSMMEHIIQNNLKQDDRMDKQDNIMEKIVTNLTELNEGYKQLNIEVKNVKGNVETVQGNVETVQKVQRDNELKYSIDTGVLFRNFVLKIAIPLGFLGAIATQVIKYLK